jgi:Tfp pilus assembly protein PilO
VTRRWKADKLWAGGGAAGALLALAVGWFFFISPMQAEAAELHDQAAAAEARLTALQRRLVDLREDNAEVQKYRAALARDRLALPTAAGTSDLLRNLQTVATETGVSVDGVVVGAPRTTEDVAAVSSLPITLTVVGEQPRLDDFLDELQKELPRAVLIDSVNSVPEGKSKSLADGASMTLTLQAFVAAPEAPAKPVPVPTPAGTPAG